MQFDQLILSRIPIRTKIALFVFSDKENEIIFILMSKSLSKDAGNG